MNWDKYYLDMCKTVATNSKCLSRHIGAIIVADKSIISTGYNGPPRGVPNCGAVRWAKDSVLKELRKTITVVDFEKCPRQNLGYKSGEGLHICVAGHAERNALINAARHGTAVKGAIMYMDCPIPCSQCMVEIINAGIVEVVCTEMRYYDEVTKYIVSESGIKLRQFDLSLA